MELSDREIKIIHAMDSLINPALKDVPFDMRRKVCEATLAIRKIDYNEDELTDIVQAITAEKKLTDANAIGLLGKYGHLLKGI